MQVNFVNQSSQAQPRTHILEVLKFIKLQLPKHPLYKSNSLRLKKLKAFDLTVVFLNTAQARSLNQQYRGRDYATDVLSFGDLSTDSLGELVLCPQVLKKQAKEHGLSFQLELAYMLIHGVLHLLGFDHEGSQKQAKLMFAIQDDIFERLEKKLKR